MSGLDNMLDFTADKLGELDSDSLWGKMALSTNYNGANDYCVYRQVGKLVEVRFVATPKQNFSANSANLLLATGLPKNCQPDSYAVRSVAFHNGKAYRIEVPTKTNANGGKIYIARNGNALDGGYLITGQVMFIRGGYCLIYSICSPQEWRYAYAR